MAETFYHTTIVELHIVYDGTYYFYNRHENGRFIINANRIDAERAANIIQLNGDDPAVTISQRGQVQIGSAHGWSWMAQIVAQTAVAG